MPRYIKGFLLLIYLIVPCHAFSQKSVAFLQAKFKTGDNPAYRETGFDDGAWPLISTTTRWEGQGYKKYDGYAWYRMHFKLSSAMRKQAYWKDSLSVLLSKIDDVDESFLNGVKIGQTGLLPSDPKGPAGKWDTYRVYNINADSKIINWDGENVIAVRVYDISNGGGLFGPAPSVKMMEPQDAIKLNLFANDKSPGVYHASITNTGKKTIDGTWTVSIKDGANNKIIKSVSKKITLNAFATLNDNITANPDEREEVTSLFKESHTAAVQRLVKVTPYILTPLPSPLPRINSAAVFGVRPGSPFLFKVAATGKGVLQYHATGLPAGLTINKSSGIITGKINNKGTSEVKLTVTNGLGKAIQTFTIKTGDKIALTPPMGWNSWNCWGLSVTGEKVKSSVRAIVNDGLINHGWNYINIDDGWQKPQRDADGDIMPEAKFKDMALLGDWLHSQGLKFGIYSSPGTQTCGGYLGSYQHEMQDAVTYAKWGVDYLKYDWCSYEDKVDADTSALALFQKPYQVMQVALQLQHRDILYSLCQYGLKDVWKWGDAVGGNSWRTTNDLKDNWESLKSIGFSHPEIYTYAGPGNWNDPDMLMVGKVGGWSGTLRKTQLTPDEQYTQISLWSLLSAPLLIGCDLSHLDKFTRNLITNDEVLAIDQDILGKQAEQKVTDKNYSIYVKDLADGNKAAGFFNLSDTYQKINLDFKTIGINGTCYVRDLWRQKTNALLRNNYTANVPPHGVVLLKLLKVK